MCEDPKNPKYNSFFKCYLNQDPKPDFVLVVITGSDSSLTEHYVALVSTANKYEAFILRSYNIFELSVDEYTVFIEPRNSPVTAFGDLDPDLKYKPAKDGAGVIFDVDCVLIGSLVGNQCETFVFQNGKFHEFSSCD